ncbi:DUF1906 domain-containing protein [Streptomyces sp. NPDC051940]|uniref:DUF1906 domain-containing protein n=1 Tax=Streptomyces sp. NPDC051940 TaxID=3155675 RepID=UPI00342549A9
MPRPAPLARRCLPALIAVIVTLLTGAAPAPPLPSGAPALADPRAQGAHVHQGLAFDTCLTPPLSTMRAWRASPYGGRGRGCPRQPHLTAGWLRQVHAMGWRVLPVYVGTQSPCVQAPYKRRYRLTGDPVQTGAREGEDAVLRAQRLGMREGSALYLDIESFAPVDGVCGRRTLDFVRAWSAAVRERGWLPGMYSSAESGVAMIEQARRDGVSGLPEVVWFARWHDRGPALEAEPVLARRAWWPHRRIHQYAGEVTEKYGGVELTVDRNAVDAPVAIVRAARAPVWEELRKEPRKEPRKDLRRGRR